MTELKRRRKLSLDKHKLFSEGLSGAQAPILGNACVYATGSYGRKEAGEKSDLDLFIVGLDRIKKIKREDGSEKEVVIGSRLKNLDAICLKSDLISTTRKLGIPEFDGDGKYLAHFYVDELLNTLGTPHDDVTNTFAARLLLLLESTPILENVVYNEVIGNVVTRYWRDYEDHSSDFMPAFLANDILRLWRTFCINYEAKTQRFPIEQKAEGRAKNYKLKHSRLLTCYSALLYLLAIFTRNQTVSPTDAVSMVQMTPTERLEWLLEQDYLSIIHNDVRRLLEQYDRFLINTKVGDRELIENFKDREKVDSYMKDAFLFGDTMANVLNSIGEPNRFRRLLLV